MTDKKLILSIAISGALAVILGAFGAHFLKEKLSEASLSAYQTGVQYQFIHTLAALGSFMLLQRFPSSAFRRSIYSFLLGILFFSGSLFLLSLKTYLQIPLLSLLGPITPIGGLFFILGWIYLAIAVYKTP